MEDIEISHIQKQFWVLQNVYKTNTAYNIPLVLKISGKPEIPALEYAVKQLVKRHESLRLCFYERNNTIFGTESRFDEGKLKCGFERITETFSEAPLSPKIMEVVHTVFHLNEWPLFRMKLLIFPNDVSVLTIVFHHIIVDLRSKNIFVEELSELYNSFRANRVPELRPTAENYSYYAAKEKAWLKTAAAAEAKTSWKELIDPAPDTLTLPIDLKRPKINSLDGRRKYFLIGKEQSAEIRRFADKNSVSTFTVLLTAYSILLNRLTNQSSFIVGVPFTNRRDIRLSDTFGCFVNILPLVIRISDDLTGLELLRQVRQSLLKIHRIQEMPFLQLIEYLKGRETNSTLQAGFTFEPPVNLSISDLETRPLIVEKNGSQLELFMTLWEEDGIFNGYLEYSSLLFGESSISGFIERYRKTVGSLMSSPELVLPELDILPEEESQLIYSWNNTDHQYSQNICLHQKFEQQVKKTPDAPAILSGPASLSYYELDLHINRLANYLIDAGVVPEDIVTICMDRSIEIVIAIYAIHKAGAAYLPVDPAYPMERIAMILDDAKPKMILTKTGSVHNIPPGFELLILDDILVSPLSENDLPPSVGVNSRNLAYLMYTSGSTGKPKGVMIEHHSVINKLEWMQGQHPLGPEDTLLLKTPVTFDVSVWELFWWMFNGARLAILKPGGEKDPGAIIKEVESRKVTAIVFVPSMFSPLVGYIKAHDTAYRLRSLKWIIQIGEALSPQLVSSFNELLTPDFNPLIVNTYGPTEATVAVSWYNCPKENHVEKIYIGKPIQNTKLLVVNSRNKIQPIGVAGELVITGVNLARGYLNRPDLNSQKFVLLDTGRLRKVRAYKTGDLAKWNTDGNLDFIGRTDTQVKIRGHRIELGDIESKLLDIHKIKSAAVIVNTSNPENHFIVAYVTLKIPGSSGTDEIRHFLVEKLPDYMIPAHIMILNDLPLNTSGKIDRKALPEPGIVITERFVAPASVYEKKLQQIWRELLKIEKIGITTNFFDLGGNSLIAIRVVSEIKEKLNLDVEPIHIMEYPNIRSLAGFLAENDENRQERVFSQVQEADDRRQSFMRLKSRRT